MVSHHDPQTKINAPHILFMPHFMWVSLHSDGVPQIPYVLQEHQTVAQAMYRFFAVRHLNAVKKLRCLIHYQEVKLKEH